MVSLGHGRPSAIPFQPHRAPPQPGAGRSPAASPRPRRGSTPAIRTSPPCSAASAARSAPRAAGGSRASFEILSALLTGMGTRRGAPSHDGARLLDTGAGSAPSCSCDRLRTPSSAVPSSRAGMRGYQINGRRPCAHRCPPREPALLRAPATGNGRKPSCAPEPAFPSTPPFARGFPPAWRRPTTCPFRAMGPREGARSNARAVSHQREEPELTENTIHPAARPLSPLRDFSRSRCRPPRRRRSTPALQPRSGAQRAFPSRLHGLGRARRRAHQRRARDPGLPLRPSSAGGGHHRQIRQKREIGQINRRAPDLATTSPAFARGERPLPSSRPPSRPFGLADAPTLKGCARRGWRRTTASGSVCFRLLQGFRNFFTNVGDPTPADLDGLRIRRRRRRLADRSAPWGPAHRDAFGDVYPGSPAAPHAIDGAELTYQNIVAGT